MSEITILTEKVLSDKKYELKMYEFEKTGNGTTVQQKREVYFRPSSTSILLYDSERKTVLLTRQFRLPVYLNSKKDSLMEACAGLIDHGEFPEKTIVREVEEETGYRISEIQKVAEGYTSPASLTEYMHFYLGKYSPSLKVSAGGGLKQEGEEIENLEISFEEARHLLKSNKINDVKTILLLQQAIIQQIIE